MDIALLPDRFDVEPNDEKATKQWWHWYKIFGNFLRSIDEENQNMNKRNVLTNLVSSEVYELFCDADTYDLAIAILKRTYDKQPNEIFARHNFPLESSKTEKLSTHLYKRYKVLAKIFSFGNFHERVS